MNLWAGIDVVLENTSKVNFKRLYRNFEGSLRATYILFYNINAYYAEPKDSSCIHGVHFTISCFGGPL